MSSMVLSNDGLAGFNWQQVVYNQIVARKAEEYQETSTKLQEAMSGNNAYYDNMSSRYAHAKASINNAEVAVGNGKKGTEKIREQLLKLRSAVTQYGQSDSKAMLRTQFDDAIDQINRTADIYAKAYNPIGNVTRVEWTPNTISFTGDLLRPEVHMTGSYAGADFYIETEDSVWVPDPGVSMVSEYTSYSPSTPEASEKTGAHASTRGGLKLESYDAETGAVTVTVDPNGETPRTVTGTLKTGGLGLMQSWFYDLETEEGRQKALDAISAAEGRLTATEANLTTMSSQVKSESARVEDGLNTLKATRSAAMKQQIQASYAAQVKVQQELQILRNTFSTITSQQATYASMFSSVKTSPLFDFTS